MNNSFYIIPVLLVFFSCSNAAQQNTSDNANVDQIQQDTLQQVSSQVSLPDSAVAFIQQYFATVALQNVIAKKSPTAEGTFYEAKLKDNTEIDFGKTGNWIEVKAEEPHQLPTGFFPEVIRTYLESNFAGIGVESIDKDEAGFELELTNDANLYFDPAGVFIKQEK